MTDMSNDIQALTAAAVAQIVADGRLCKMVNEAAEKTVRSIVTDALSTYSPFGKALSEGIKDAMVVDLKSLGLAGYNQTVMNVVKSVLDGRIEADGRAAIEKALTDLLGGEVPKTIKFSEIVRKFGEWAKKDNYDGRGRATVDLEEFGSYGSRWLKFSFTKPSLYSSSPHKEEIARCLLDSDGKVFGLTADGIDFSKTVFIGGGLRGFVRVLFQFQAAGTLIEIDTKDPHDILVEYEDGED